VCKHVRWQRIRCHGIVRRKWCRKMFLNRYTLHRTLCYYFRNNNKGSTLRGCVRYLHVYIGAHVPLVKVLERSRVNRKICTDARVCYRVTRPRRRRPPHMCTTTRTCCWCTYVIPMHENRLWLAGRERRRKKTGRVGAAAAASRLLSPV